MGSYVITAIQVSTHSRPKAAGYAGSRVVSQGVVSTHSRPKAAGSISLQPPYRKHGFNTQPPEGGWA